MVAAPGLMDLAGLKDLRLCRGVVLLLEIVF